MPSDNRLVTDLPRDQRPNINKPRWDQATFTGRLKHFFTTACPINLFVREKTLDEAKEIVDSYRAGRPPSGLTIEQLWKAKTLYDSAFHPETGQKMFLLGRMSCQVPCNMVITGVMLSFYKTNFAIISTHWVNQSFNAIVNYTNRAGENAPTGQRLFFAYCCATGGALTAALGLNRYANAKKLHPLYARLVPFCAIALANAINIPVMRSKEFTEGISVEDAHGNKLGTSTRVAAYAIPMVVASRIFMAIPFMVLSPIMMERIVKKAWYQRRPWIAAPIQTLFAGFMLTFATPTGCALFPQKSQISVDRLEPDLRAKIQALPQAPKYVYYNKGL
uniref:Sidoreflexin n=1 Tax=Panagrellus redivivus TaxID=6233 RepID=A0A7E4WBV0_PANRE